MAHPITQIVAGIFVFAVPIVIGLVIFEGWKIFSTLLGSHGEAKQEHEQPSEEENLEYIQRHFGQVRID